MNRFSNWVLRHRKTVVVLFAAVAILCAVLIPLVTVNYNMVDYLPAEAQSTQAIQIMQDEFGGELPNARVMLKDVTIPQALAMVDELKTIDGVAAVSWLDDAIGREALLATPLSALDQAVVAPYYQNNAALITVTIRSGMEKTAVAAIRNLIGDQNAISGDAVNTATAQALTVSEVIKAMEILVPVILLILVLTTSSWLEPLLFMLVVGVAVVINMGLNAFSSTTSYITQAVSPVLQLAVSLDYAIFLLHSFHRYRVKYEPVEAMARAMKKAFAAIFASAATTIFGFMALMFMRFGIGSDLGLNLVRGVLLSFLSVIVFLPALTLACEPLLNRTRHRRLIPDFKKAGRFMARVSVPFLVIAVLIVMPCFLAQSNLVFQYGTGDLAAATSAGQDAAEIEQVFGTENALVVLVPRGDTGREAALGEALSQVDHVTQVVSYSTAVSPSVPVSFLSDDVTGMFYSPHYARLILYTDMPAEGAETFATVEKVQAVTSQYYDTGAYVAGQSATLYDMKNVVSSDTGTVNLVAVLGIFLVLLITYKSLSLPLILLFTIESAIWLNLSLSYFAGQSFSFIGYLVVSTVQLGSTVDYAILLSDRYLSDRRKLPKREAIRKALGDNMVALITSATILSTAGFAMAMTSTNGIVAELGSLLGRGTVLSLVMVLCVLPALLVLLDKVVQKTTLHNRFHQEPADDLPDEGEPLPIAAEPAKPGPAAQTNDKESNQ